MYEVDFSSRVPIYEQIFNDVIKLAGAGVLKPGDKLPPVRVVASQLGINPNTAAKAYRELENQGYIYSTVGRGSFLTDKLGAHSAQRLYAVKDFREAARKAWLFGVPKEKLLDIVTEICAE